MKLLFVLENYIPHVGGAEIVFKELAERLAKSGHEINIVTHKISGTKEFEVINKVKVHRVKCFGSRYLFTFFSIPKVIKLAREADIIHTTTFNGAFPSWIASKFLNKPSVVTIHEVWIGKWKNITDMNFFNAFLHNILERIIYLLKFDRYVCVSEYTKRQLLEIKKGEKEKIKLIYNGIDYDLWKPEKHDGKNIRKKFGLKNSFIYLFYGRPGISKGLEYLIKAVPYISDKIPGSKLLAVVSNDKAYLKRREEILELSKNLNISDKIIFLDAVPREELPDYIKAADCVVIPSLSEGFGFTVAESCAMDKPVIASNISSIPEVVSGEHILIRPKDSIEIALAVDRVYKKKLKKYPIKRFKITDNIKKYLKEYKNLLKDD